jgi:Spy/CpxP family protein refolding chaperone
MIGLALGLGALGFFIAHKARRHGFAYARGCHGGHHRGWGGPGGPGWGRHGGYGGGPGDGVLRFISSRLDTTPSQERVIQRELGALVERARDARRGAFDGKADLARAMGSPVFDDSAATAGLAGVGKAADELSTQAIESLRKIHEVLDDEQRKELARLIEGGGWRFGGRPGGPYR